MPLGILVWIGISIGLWLIRKWLSKSSSSKGGSSDFETPKVETGTPIPVAFGTVSLEPIVVWFDYVRFVPQDPDEGLTDPLGHMAAYVGLIAWGPVSNWVAVIYNNKLVVDQTMTRPNYTANGWGLFRQIIATLIPGANGSGPGTLSASTAVFDGGHGLSHIYVPDAWGGSPTQNGGDGGVFAWPTAGSRYHQPGVAHDFFLGLGLQLTMSTSTYLTGVPMGGACLLASGTYPRWRRYCYVAVDQGSLGISGSFKPVNYVVTGSIGLMANGLDANAARALYSILTDQEWGLSIPPELIDESTFSAAAFTLAGESFGVSGALRDQRPASDYIEELCKTIDAVLYRDPTTGLLGMQLIRGGYDPASLSHFDESEIVELEWTRGEVADAANEITVEYTDRDLLYQKNAVTVQDHANIETTGAIRTKTLQFPWIPTEAQALSIAARELKAEVVPLGSGRMVVTRTAWDAVPGDVVVLNFARYGLSGVCARVLSVDIGSLGADHVEVTFAEDRYAVPDIPYTVVDGPNAPPPPSNYDIPYVTMELSNTPSTGLVVLLVFDAYNYVTQVEVQFSVNNVVTIPYITLTNPYTYQVPLDATYNTDVAWRVTYVRNGVTSVITGTGHLPPAAPQSITQAVAIRNNGNPQLVFTHDGRVVLTR